MFENVDAQTNARTDGRTTARLVYYKLTSEPSAQVSLKYGSAIFYEESTYKTLALTVYKLQKVQKV